MPTELIVRNSIEINAMPERVWDALINPAITPKYMFNCAAESDWQVGSPVLWKGVADGITYVQGHVVANEPYSKLAYSTFGPGMGLEDVPSNYPVATYELQEANGKTILSISQGDFADMEKGQERYDETVGGWEMTLKALKAVVEESIA